MLKKNIRRQVLVPLTLTFVMLTGMFVYTSYSIRMEEYSNTLQNRYKRVQNILTSIIDSHAESMMTSIEFIAEQKRFQNAMLAQDRNALLNHGSGLLERLSNRLQVTHFYFYDKKGEMILRVYQPENISSTTTRYTKQQAMKTGKPYSGLELGVGGTFTLRAVYPWKVNNNVIGYIELGQEFDHILQELKTVTEIDFLVSLDKRNLERSAWENSMQMLGREANWDLHQDKVIIDQTIPSIPAKTATQLISTDLQEITSGLKVTIADATYRARSFPLQDVTKQNVGDFVMLNNITAQTSKFRTFIIQIALFSLILCGCFFSLAYKVLGRVDARLAENQERLRREFDKQANTNRTLENEVAARKHTEQRLVELNEHLEQRVEERTTELNSLNSALETAYKNLQSQQATILQQDKMACIGQLAASVAHDINNPIGFVAGNLEVLRVYWNKMVSFITTQQSALAVSAAKPLLEKVENERNKLKINYIQDEFNCIIAESLEGTERVKQIVLNLKGFSRLDNADAQYADIRECLESTIGIVNNELRHKADIVKEYSDTPEVFCYPQQLNQVFMNLLLNASQAIDKWGTIAIKTWSDENNIFVAISDTGCGISGQNLERLFEPFFTTKEPGVGTGLGLPIVKEIIKRHNGDISVESELNKGTVFTLRLPLHGVESEAHHA